MARNNPPLKPTQTAQLLQGFLNIQETLSIESGRLKESDLDRYNQATLFLDPNAPVADYFTRNFNQIAPLDGDPSTISVDDLVVRRPELPLYDAPIFPPPVKGSGEAASILHRFNPNDLFHD
jgi:hypothetical protein